MGPGGEGGMGGGEGGPGEGLWVWEGLKSGERLFAPFGGGEGCQGGGSCVDAREEPQIYRIWLLTLFQVFATLRSAFLSTLYRLPFDTPAPSISQHSKASGVVRRYLPPLPRALLYGISLLLPPASGGLRTLRGSRVPTFRFPPWTLFPARRDLTGKRVRVWLFTILKTLCL